MNDIRSILNLLERKAYRIQDNGTLTNFNVDRSLPKIQIRRKSNGEVYDLHYKDDAELEKGLAKEKGFERFDADNAEPQKGGNDELDAIVAKYAKPNLKLQDVFAAEQEAGSDSNARYVLAYMAKSLGMDGLYNSKGNFIYMDGDKPAGAANASMQQAKDLAEKGLLPDDVARKIAKVQDSSREEVAQKAQDVIATADKNQKLPDDVEVKGKTDEPKTGTNSALEAARTKYNRFMELLTKAMEDQTPGAVGNTGPNESWQPKSYADILLLEALAADELEELEQLYAELKAMEEFDDDLDDQIADAVNKYDMWKAGNLPGQEKEEEPAGVNYSSDEEVQKAIDDPENYIANEMPKELESKQANGLLKATDRGKNKSASAAAVQKIMTQIGAVTQEPEFDIKVDGMYGPASVTAVKKAQELAGITVDGDPGAETAAELVAFSKKPDGKMRDADLGGELDRAIALFTKGIESLQTSESTNFASLISLVEKNLNQLNEELSPEEQEELKGLIAGSIKSYLDDGDAMLALPQELQDKLSKFTELRNKYNELAKAAAKKAEELPKQIAQEILAGVKGMGTREDEVYAAVDKLKDKAMFDKIIATNADLLTTMLDDFGGTDLKLLLQKLKAKGVDITVDRPSSMVRGGAYTYGGKKYGEHGAPGGGQVGRNANPRVGSTNPALANPPGGTTTQNASVDHSGKHAINEAASMNISMSGDNAGEVSELLGILKNAGMPNATPVGAVNMPMDMEMPAEPEGPMPCATCGGDHDADSPCGGDGYDNSPDESYGELADIVKLSGGPNSNKNPGDIRVKDPSPYESEEEVQEWDYEPDEEYKDDDYMTKDLSGGINRRKKSFAKAQDGDNAMAVESIKDRLYKELQKKTK